MKNINIETASIKDVEEILELQKLAYLSEAEIINDFTIEPLHQTLDESLSEFTYQIFEHKKVSEKLTLVFLEK